MLIVDDSAIVRKLLADSLKGEPDIEVVGGAGDPFVARDMILRLEPDVLTLDIEMPRMDGLSFLRRLMAHRPMPVIIISSLTQAGSAATIDALRAGAMDVLAKPGGPGSVGELGVRLKQRVRAIRGMAPSGLARALHRWLPVGAVAAVRGQAESGGEGDQNEEDEDCHGVRP